jgi:two-component system, LytTR family, response regulator
VTGRLRAYLVDDEPLALKRLTRLLDATGRVRVVGSATDPEAALAYLAAHDVDVLFLDIQMPGMTGFELLGRLTAPPPVVFTTAYDRYAVKAFEVSSLDYLLKPVEKPRLAATLDKLERLRGGAARPDLRAVIEEVAAALRTGPAFPDRIASRSGERVQLVELARVTHFFARDKLTFAASAGKDYVVDATIAELETRLDPRAFVRIHRATLLNLAWVQEVHAWFGGRLMVRLKDDKHTELEVARDRARAFKERLAL